ncbi:tetratricopeptide repeat protein [Bacteroidota bacterium]
MNSSITTTIMRCILIIFILALVQTNLVSISITDSLLNEIENAQEIEKIELLNLLSSQYLRENPKKSIDYGNEALKLSRDLKNLHGEAKALQCLGLAHEYLSDFNNAYKNHIESLRLFKSLGDKKQSAQTLNNIGVMYAKQNDHNRALKYMEKSLVLRKNINDNLAIASSLNNIGMVYYNLNEYDRALEYYTRSVKIKEKLGDKKALAKSYNNIGLIYSDKANYFKALEYHLKSLKYNEEIGDKYGIAIAYANIGVVHQSLLFYDEALELYQKSLKIHEEINNKHGIAISYNNIGVVYEGKKMYRKSIEYHQKAMEINQSIDNKGGVSASYYNIGKNYLLLEEYDKALENLNKSMKIREELGNKYGIASTSITLGKLYIKLDKTKLAYKYINRGFSLATEIQAQELIDLKFGVWSEFYATKGNYKKAFEFGKIWLEKWNLMFEENILKTYKLQTEYETEKAEKEIKQLKIINALEVEKSDILQEKSNILWFSLIIIVILIVLLAIIAFNRYRLNKRAKFFLKEKNRLEIENRKRVINLFGQQVSQEIVDELLNDTSAEATKKKFVCIMFLDIRGFTPLMENKEPEEIIEYQNKVFGFMIEIINRHHGIINQFLGDGYMATFGAPISKGNDCQNAVNAATEIIKMVNRKSFSGDIPSTRIGIGLHAGNVVAGNVGTSVRKQYSITGNTVILASRIEQLNKDYDTQLLISKEVYDNINFGFENFIELGPSNVKGRENPIIIYKLFEK